MKTPFSRNGDWGLFVYMLEVLLVLTINWWMLYHTISMNERLFPEGSAHTANMKNYKVGKMMKKGCLSVGVFLACILQTQLVWATNITELPGGSGNDQPAVTAPAEVPTQAATEPVPTPQPEVVTEAPVVVPTEEITQGEEEESVTEDAATEEDEQESLTDEESSEEVSSSEAEVSDSEEETWPMGFSGAGDGQTTEESSETQSMAAVKKEGAGPVAKFFAVVLMILLIGGVVAYGYLSLMAKEEMRRRERRARAWNDSDLEEDE
jgi:hypothetical protein